MTAGFLARLAERARGGGQPAMVRPDLPPAYVPGLLARAPAADFEGIGIAELWSGVGPAGQDVPDSGARPDVPDRDLGPPRDATQIPPSAATDPHRAPERSELAGSRGARAPDPEAWPPSAARAGRGPGRPRADVAPARHEQRRQQPEGVADPVGADLGNPDDRAPAQARSDHFAAVRSGRLAAARTGPEPSGSRRQAAMPSTATAGPEPEASRRQTAVAGAGTAGMAPHAAGPPRPGPREPDVHISIGRIEVRLEEAAPPPGRAQRRPRPDTAVPLEEYLRRRSGTSS